jgi:hypothetical protein
VAKPKHNENSGVHTDDEVLDKMTHLAAAPEFANYEEENLSLPPYWVTAIGKQFAARVIDLDNADPDFPRYVLEALAPVDCQNGPRDEAEDVHVKTGEFFTCSLYAGLPLGRYIGCRVLVECVGTRKTKQPQPMYVFKMVMHPEDKAMVMQDRKALALQKMAAFRESRKDSRALPARGETTGASA